MNEKVKVKIYSLSNDLLDEFDFNKTIRFDDLRKNVIKDGIRIIDCNRNLIINNTSNGSYEALIYRHRFGRLQWNVPLEDFTIEDYLEEFPTNEIKLIRVPDGVGGIIFLGVEWETICNVLKNIYELGSAILTTYEIYKILKDTKVIPKIIDNEYSTNRRPLYTA